MTLDLLSLARALQAWLHSFQAIHGPLSEAEAEVYRSLGGFLLAVGREGEDTFTPRDVLFMADFPQEDGQ